MGHYLSTEYFSNNSAKYMIVASVSVFFVIMIDYLFNESKRLTLTYDDEEDLDEKTIIAILDLHFNMGKIPKIKEEFNSKRRQILSQAFTESNRNKYIRCVLQYDQILGQELESNLENICNRYDLSKEDIKKSQNKYINNSNSHKLLGREEVLNAKIPRWLTTSAAKDIKVEMEEYAFRQQQFFIEFFEKQLDQQSLIHGNRSNVSQPRMMAEEIMEYTNYDIVSDQDPDNIIFKSTTLAKYITLDQILEKNHGINEAQLKRMLYKQYFDDLASRQGFLSRLRKSVFR